MLLAAYLDRVSAALASKDGETLAQLLSLSRSNVDIDLQPLSVEQVGHICQSKLARFDAFAEVIAGMIQARKHIEVHDFEAAYASQIASVIKFMEVFRGETNWVMPLMHVLVLDTRLVAARADRDASAKTGDDVHDSLRSAEQHLKKGFSMSANDRAPPEHNKKLGSLFIVNQLFKIYFKLNTIHLCRNLIRAVEGPAFPEFERFNKGDKVTYQYYVGRISMFEDQYHKAEKCLDYAWKHCHQSKLRNKRMILQFLVPVKLLLGVMPSPQLIEAYALHEYTGLTDAIRGGNLRLFNEYLDKYQEQFIQQGVYLLIEKLRLVVLRNLFKKVYIIRQSHQLRLQDFQQSLEFITGETMDMDEIECILANLIFKGYIKGYMSHQKKILVVSKAQPFPPITEVSS
ncbi:Pci domain-containing protein 2, partial [Globisporangium splendens]